MKALLNVKRHLTPEQRKRRSGKPTLDEFISMRLTNRLTLANAYVKEPGWAQLYVRVTQRGIGRETFWPTLDLANLKAKQPGKGAFTKLVERIRKEYPDMTIYVESVPSVRFQTKLKRMGFLATGIGFDCFVLHTVDYANRVSRSNAGV